MPSSTGMVARSGISAGEGGRARVPRVGQEPGRRPLTSPARAVRQNTHSMAKPRALGGERERRFQGGIMLKNLDPLLNADVLHALRAMGHGDALVLCDTKFPAHAMEGRDRPRRRVEDRQAADPQGGGGRNHQGRRGNRQVTTPGAVVGELSVLLDKPHTADVRALETSQFHVAVAASLLGNDLIATLYVGVALARRLDSSNEALIELKHQLAAGQPPLWRPAAPRCIALYRRKSSAHTCHSLGRGRAQAEPTRIGECER
jgi:hypothetical protein